MTLYYFSATRGDTEVAASYRDVISPKLRAIPLLTIIGSRWPMFVMFSSENLRRSPPPEGSPDVANDDSANCLDIDQPVLDWTKFQSLFWAEEDKIKDWMVDSIRYVYSWQMIQTPKEALTECPLGYLTAVLIKAFTCATSESSCFHSFANQVEQFLDIEPNIVEALAHSWWPLAMLLNHMAKATRHKYFLDFTEAELSGNFPMPQSGYSPFDMGRFLATQDQASQSFRDLLSALPRLGPAPPEAPNLVYVTMIYGESFNRHMRRFCSRARAVGIPGQRLLLFTLDQPAYEMFEPRGREAAKRVRGGGVSDDMTSISKSGWRRTGFSVSLKPCRVKNPEMVRKLREKNAANAAPTEPAADSPEAVEQVKPQAEKEGIEKTKEPEKTQETERTESPAEEVLGGQTEMDIVALGQRADKDEKTQAEEKLPFCSRCCIRCRGFWEARLDAWERWLAARDQASRRSSFEAELRRVAADKLPSPGVLELLTGPPVETMEKAFQLSFSDKEILLAFSEAQLQRISLFSLQDGIPWRQILPRLLFQLILGLLVSIAVFCLLATIALAPTRSIEFSAGSIVGNSGIVAGAASVKPQVLWDFHLLSLEELHQVEDVFFEQNHDTHVLKVAATAKFPDGSVLLQSADSAIRVASNGSYWRQGSTEVFLDDMEALQTLGATQPWSSLSEVRYQCLVENAGRCIRGTPGILNKFTLPLVCAHLGLDSVWIDLDVFLMSDPTPAIVAHAEQGPYDILVSGSFEADCICNGIVRSPDANDWLLAVIVWMYHHPYEHDQKTFSAFLNYTERVAQDPLDLPEIPPWETLDPINQFVTPDIFEGNGWMGDLDKILIYHFLNGESDTGSGLDPSGQWRKEFGRFTSDNETCEGKSCNTGGKVTLMDLFYGQPDEELYTTPMPAYENEAIRAALLSSKKAFRSSRLLGLPCGPMVGWEAKDEDLSPEAIEERLKEAREKVALEKMASA
eukprot:symbB.v1.2.034164.t2/scaffold4362.1/size40683/3